MSCTNALPAERTRSDNEIGRRVREQYAGGLRGIARPDLLILGNVDNPSLAHSFAAEHPGVHEPDGQIVHPRRRTVRFRRGSPTDAAERGR